MTTTGLALPAVACRGSDNPPLTTEGPPSGTLEVGWSDSTGPVRLSLPAWGRWCAADSLLEISGVRNDTAVGIVLLAADSGMSGLAPGTWSVMPARVFIPWRPRALAALRMADTAGIVQLESSRGEVTLTGPAGSGLSGSFDIHLIASAGTDSLRMTGDFRAVAVAPAGGPCGRIDKPPPG